MERPLKMDPCNYLSQNIFPGCGLPQLPFYLVGDEIFALKPWLLRPYPGKNIEEEESIFNYRLSRARGVIENWNSCCKMENLLQ